MNSIRCCNLTEGLSGHFDRRHYQNMVYLIKKTQLKYSFTFFRRLEELEDYDIDGASVPGKSPTVQIHHDQIINTSLL